MFEVRVERRSFEKVTWFQLTSRVMRDASGNSSSKNFNTSRNSKDYLVQG